LTTSFRALTFDFCPFAFQLLALRPGHPAPGFTGPWRQLQFNLAVIQAHPYYLDQQAVSQLIDLMGALPNQPVLGGIELVIVIIQRADMHQAFYIDTLQFDEDAEIGDAGNNAFEDLTDPVLRIFPLEPVHHISHSFISTPLVL